MKIHFQHLKLEDLQRSFKNSKLCKIFDQDAEKQRFVHWNGERWQRPSYKAVRFAVELNHAPDGKYEIPESPLLITIPQVRHLYILMSEVVQTGIMGDLETGTHVGFYGEV